MILLIDNYDSFTYNLKQEIEILGHECQVFRNDKITLEEIKKIQPSHIILSPGPGRPESAGITLAVIKEFASKIPILGVCLGHQAIGLAMGGVVRRAQKPMHGKISQITHDQKGIFKDLENPLLVARYHSLVVDRESLLTAHTPLEVTATSEDGEIMAFENKTIKIAGVQFHPESIATQQGRKMIANFLGVSN